MLRVVFYFLLILCPLWLIIVVTAVFVGGRIEDEVIAFASDRSGNYEIYLLDTTTRALINLTQNSTDDLNPAWSQDGERLTFISMRPGNFDLYVMDIKIRRIMTLTETPSNEAHPRWSPDGEHIAYGLDGDIRVINVETGEDRAVIQQTVLALYPTWSPDGSQLAYVSELEGDASGRYSILILDLATNRIRNLNIQFYTLNSLAWSPDGTQMVFSSRDTESANSNLFRLDLATLQVENLTPNLEYALDPHWSPDGRQLSFTNVIDNRLDVYRLRLDDRTIMPLLQHPANTINAVWRP